MALDDAVGRDQPDAVARKFTRMVKFLKWLEDLFGISHVEPRAVITHEINLLPFLIYNAKLNPGIKRL